MLLILVDVESLYNNVSAHLLPVWDALSFSNMLTNWVRCDVIVLSCGLVLICFVRCYDVLSPSNVI